MKRKLAPAGSVKSKLACHCFLQSCFYKLMILVCLLTDMDPVDLKYHLGIGSSSPSLSQAALPVKDVNRMVAKRLVHSVLRAPICMYRISERVPKPDMHYLERCLCSSLAAGGYCRREGRHCHSVQTGKWLHGRMHITLQWIDAYHPQWIVIIFVSNRSVH